MARVSKFKDNQKLEIALDLLASKLSHAEICRKYEISSTYAYKLKDRALEILRMGIGKPIGKPSKEIDDLRKNVADMDELAGDQAFGRRMKSLRRISPSPQRKNVSLSRSHYATDALSSSQGGH